MENQIIDILTEKRSNLHPKSVKTYVSLLKNIIKNMDYESVEDLDKNPKKSYHISKREI